MTLPEMIYQHSLRLPDAAAREALDFIEFLEQRYGVSQPKTTPVQRRQAGTAKGILQIVEEDDAHLADFGEYMP
jgi:hypothetical protein